MIDDTNVNPRNKEAKALEHILKLNLVHQYGLCDLFNREFLSL